MEVLHFHRKYTFLLQNKVDTLLQDVLLIVNKMWLKSQIIMKEVN